MLAGINSRKSAVSISHSRRSSQWTCLDGTLPNRTVPQAIDSKPSQICNRRALMSEMNFPYQKPSVCFGWITLIVAVVSIVGAQGDQARPPTRPPYERLLSGDEAKEARRLQQIAGDASRKDDYDAVVRHLESLLKLRVRVQGADHWESVTDRWNMTRLRLVAALTREKRAEFNSTVTGVTEAQRLEKLGKATEAEPLYRAHLKACLELLGKNHPDIAACYGSLATNLTLQGRQAEALPMFQQSLRLCRDLLGKDHPNTALGCSNLAQCLSALNRLDEAGPLFRESLEAFRRIVGSDHLHIGLCCNNLAAHLNRQGRYADAEPFLTEALRVFEAAGESHRFTHIACDNLASNLGSQGRLADALPYYQRALELRRKYLKDDHPDTASSYNGLGASLHEQGRHAEALPLLQKAHDLRRRLLTEKHPDYLESLGNLASCLSSLKQRDRAEALFEKALELARSNAGEKSVKAATVRNNLGDLLREVGRVDEAIVHYEEALAVFRRTYGKHPHVTLALNNVAACLDAQGKLAAAEERYRECLTIERELLGEQHPSIVTAYTNLAMNLIIQSNHEEAESLLTKGSQSYEAARLNAAASGVDRAVFSEKSPYPLLAAVRVALGQPVRAWQAVETDLSRGLSDEVARRNGQSLNADEKTRQAELLTERTALQQRVLRLLSKEDVTDAERQELTQLKSRRKQIDTDIAQLAVAISQRSVAPLSRIQKSIPDDAAMVIWIDLSNRSGRIEEHWACVVRSTGAPVWEKIKGLRPPEVWSKFDHELPGGLRVSAPLARYNPDTLAMVARVLRHQRLTPLLKHLDGVKSLYVIPTGQMAGVPLELMAPKFSVRYIPSGSWLVRMQDRARAKGRGILALGNPDSKLGRLPGAQMEAIGIGQLFKDEARVLVGSSASESALNRLQKTSELAKFRYLHFATHGEADNARTLESALLLSRHVRDESEPVDPNHEPVDGRLTAREVLDSWSLNADLVTLSACETAIGRPGGGDGMLGFGQALLAAGSRSVCLSLWKVDDTATALLMHRFYQNLLGSRGELTAPLKKADALAEAKRWLRQLSHQEAQQILAEWKKELVSVNPAVRGADLTVGGKSSEAQSDHPFAHPRFWSAFVLIGAPD